MYQAMWFVSLLFFLGTGMIFSFDIETPDGTIKFKGWVGKMSEDV